MGLCLHKGARKVDMDVIDMVKTPEGTNTWKPVAHATAINTVRKAIDNLGLELTSEEFALSTETKVIPEDALLFGLLGIKQGDDYEATIGIRNSHNKLFSFGLTAGSRVFVCDNLAFSGEITLNRRHSKNIHAELEDLVNDALSHLPPLLDYQNKRIETYKKAELSESKFDSFAIALVDRNALPCSKLTEFLNQYRNSDTFDPGTVWSAFNAVTEVSKGTNVFNALPERTQILHSVADRFCQ